MAKTKKCPFCAETIKIEAIVCRYCKRDLPVDLSLNEDLLGKRLSPSDTKSIKSNLSVQEVVDLLGVWSQTVNFMSAEASEGSTKSVETITKGFGKDVLTLFLKHKITSDKEAYRLFEPVSYRILAWAMLCFAIGGESSWGNISDQQVPDFLELVSRPIVSNLQDAVIVVFDRGKLGRDETIKWCLDIGNQMANLAVYNANRGYIFYETMRPKRMRGQGSTFVKKLNSL